MATYTYNKTGIRDNVHYDMLRKEIEDVGIDSNLIPAITTISQDVIEFTTSIDFSVEDQSTLETIVNNHDTSPEQLDKFLQTQKTLKLKLVENKFMDFCEQLTGNKQRLTFEQLNTVIEGLLATDPQSAMVLSLRLLAIDAEAKREGGLEWWDTCEYHSDIVNVSSKKSKLNPLNWFKK